MWHHFEYTDGSNPYIAMTEKERDRVIRIWRRRNVEVKKLKDGFYRIYNVEGRKCLR